MILSRKELEDYVELAKKGDRDAAGSLYDAFFDKIYSFIYYRTGNRADAEDITGEVFMKMVKNIGTFSGNGPAFINWLFTISHNTLVNHYRRTSARPEELSPEPPERKEPEAGPEELALAGETKSEILSALNTLPQTQYQVIACRFFLGLSVEETAGTLDKTTGAVKLLQHRALISLRKMMKGENLERN